ncbi:cysteine-rich receptor-like protein kinase 26 isoform X2 [Triticum dicoccoides]|uniref:cysteine-rich receptor-like protein kinase 26 isoform X2 n=1 Tax=Triticum dicoccoides TaxID=85692 RepID=UPI00188DCD8E|nr:cysteine-rich receptor-like protein kinase 26 isoform X2 [Triticum dicoccoides]XP_037488270.1 cysteine-rich receptor-like protein kinase 26 isoform X2 [Triticum dicoccoides]XP_037488271.1 cysteine-rich receptor-like protein kinase 26 isoform X2 [Triticum dicoccoides]
MEHRSCSQASISTAQAPTPSSSKDTTTGERLPSEAMGPISLPMILLQKITNNFSKERLLGQGGYGKVYRGVYDDGQVIAVKQLHNTMQDIDDKQFIREFHNLMMLNHPNIVRLVSYCYETQRKHIEFEGRIVFGETTYKALCFEYMPKGSLQKHLSGMRHLHFKYTIYVLIKHVKIICHLLIYIWVPLITSLYNKFADECNGLDWQTRYRIIKGACQGLKYLHEDLEKPFYHLDLKPDNILLDENMVPKLADFGLSKLFGEEKTRTTQSPIGTIGYMPPEYILQNLVSKRGCCNDQDNCRAWWPDQ